MSRRLSYVSIRVLLPAGVALTGCQGAAQGADAELAEAATVDAAEDGGPEVITLSGPAERRLGIETTTVATDPAGLVIPYAALVYASDGSTWVFVRKDPLTYQPAPVTVAGKTGDQVAITSGPPAGTEVVTVGAAELVGIQTGIDGEE
jgi:multidrug efflux pump subunit AcrA (membrane-fusion protein)